MIGISWFSKLRRWDSFTIPELPIRTHFPSEPLGEVLSRRNERVDRSKHPFATLQPISIHFNGDISVRKIADGREYRLPMIWVEPGDIVLSKIDLKNGAVGVLDENMGRSVVTTHFAVYRPHPERLDARYLRLLVQTQAFKQWLWASRSGADGRTEVSLEDFEMLEPPLPPLEVQRAMVAEHAGALAGAEALAARAQATEGEAKAAFEAALGLGAPPPLPHRPVFVARFADLDRWSHDAVLHRTLHADASEPAFPLVRLGDVIADLENGWSPQCLARPAEADEWGVLKLGAVSFGRFDELENKSLPSGLSPRPEIEVRNGDLLISRANIARLVGATALVEHTRDRLMLCDKIFRAVPSPSRHVSFAFLDQVLRVKAVREQIETSLTGTSPTMKNISKPALLALRFPLPPTLEEQRALVAPLLAARVEAERLRAQATAARAAAGAAFEAALAG